MGTATFIRDLVGWRSDARLYRVSPPIKDEDGELHDHVIVSAVVAYSGPETYIFPADEGGIAVGWGELEGSFRGALNHELALVKAGYSVVSPGGEP